MSGSDGLGKEVTVTGGTQSFRHHIFFPAGRHRRHHIFFPGRQLVDNIFITGTVKYGLQVKHPRKRQNYGQGTMGGGRNEEEGETGGGVRPWSGVTLCGRCLVWPWIVVTVLSGSEPLTLVGMFPLCRPCSLR